MLSSCFACTVFTHAFFPPDVVFAGDLHSPCFACISSFPMVEKKNYAGSGNHALPTLIKEKEPLWY